MSSLRGTAIGIAALLILWGILSERRRTRERLEKVCATLMEIVEGMPEYSEEIQLCSKVLGERFRTDTLKTT